LWSYPLYFARTCYCKFCRFTDDIMILAISFSIFYTVANALSLSLSWTGHGIFLLLLWLLKQIHTWNGLGQEHEVFV
jgi:hypothetical protein